MQFEVVLDELDLVRELELKKLFSYIEMKFQEKKKKLNRVESRAMFGRVNKLRVKR